MKRLFLIFTALLGLASACFAQILSFNEAIQFFPGGRVGMSTFSLRTNYSSPWHPYQKVLEIASGVGSTGRRLQVYDPYTQNGAVSGNVQQWLVIPAGRPYGYGPMTYNIVNVEHNRYIEGVMEAGSVRCADANGSLLQRWYMVANNNVPNGFVLSNASTYQVLTFNSSASGSAVTLSNNVNSVGQCLTLVADAKNFTGVFDNYNFRNIIRSAASSNQVVAIFGGSYNDNAVTGLWQRYAGVHDQEWYGLSYESDLSHADSLVFKNVHASTAVGLENNVLTLGNYVVARTLLNPPIPSTRWYILPTKYTNQYYIVNAETGLALTAGNYDVSNGSRTVQWYVQGYAGQRWFITKE